MQENSASISATRILSPDDEANQVPGQEIPLKFEDLHLAGYRFLSLLGSGGMGQVFLACRESDASRVAIKMVLPAYRHDRQVVFRLRRESAVLAQLNHPHVVRCYDMVENHSGLFLIMEYVPGMLDTSALVERHGALPELLVLKIIQQAAEGLAYAQAHRIMHRDIKPSNLLIACAPGSWTEAPENLFNQPGVSIKIADFGLAKQDRPTDNLPELTRDGMVIGSPSYMAPEQAGGQKNIDFRTDIYALGMTLFYLVTAQVPFLKDSARASLRAKLEGERPDPKDFGVTLSSPVFEVFERMTAFRPDERYADYDTLLRDLSAITKIAPLPKPAPLVVAASEEPVPGEENRALSRCHLQPVLWALFLLILVIFLYVVWQQAG